MDLATTLVVLFLVAYVPPVLFAVSIARAKRYRREPRYAVVRAFLWGATLAAGLALVVNTFVQGAFVRPAVRTEIQATLVLAVVVAPLVEEAVKPLILYMGAVRRHCDEVMDGLIYGAVAGLGFAATENLLYEASALISQGPEGFLATAIARTFSSTLLHAVTGAIVGYGISLHLNGRHGFRVVIPFYLLAALIHAGYNAVVSVAAAITILPLVVIVVLGFIHLRRRIRALSLVPTQRDWHVVEGGEGDASGAPGAAQGSEVWQPVEEGAARPPDWGPVPPEEGWRRLEEDEK